MNTSSFIVSRKNIITIIGAGLCLNLGTLAFALPSKRGNAALPVEVLNKIEADPALKGVQILPDHDENVKVLYVSPANRKPQAGNFIKNTDPDCKTIKGLYDTTFNLPSYQSPEDLIRVAADQNAPVSAFFFLHFAGSVRQGDILNKIQQIYNDTETLLNQNKIAYDNYLGSKLKYEAAQKDTQAVQAEIQRLDDVIKRRQDEFLFATDEVSRAAARAALDEAIKHKQDHYPELAIKLDQKEDLEASARQEFVNAHEGVASLLENLNQSNNRLDFNTRLFEARRNVALTEYTMALGTLEARENRTMGSANVAIQVWSDEATRVDAILKSVGGTFAAYSVQRLPIHNVTIDGKYWETKTQSADGSGTGYGNGKVESISNNGGIAVGDPIKVDSPYRDKEGRPIEMLVKSLGQKDAFAMNIPVSAGSYCMTQGKAEEERIELEVSEGDALKKNVMTLKHYRPRSEAVLRPSFAMNYEYFVKAEPLNVSCELNMDLLFTSIKTSGSSGFLFWKKNWSTDDLTQTQKNGLNCKVNSAPIGDDINLQRQMEAELIETFSKDLAAEAILLRAKEWKVTEASVSVPEKSKGFAMIGTGVLAVCGGNPYCMVGGIVLKSVEELFGSQSGTGNNTQHYNTTLTRNFNYDGFTVDRASVIVDTEIK